MTFCDNCGKALSNDVKICKECNATAKRKEMDGRVFCANCGSQLRDKQDKCDCCNSIFIKGGK
ncbi:MAG: hypothetical protein LBH98_10120 [Chitinispirillales bacterium]|jgi:predicted amidophosphoribosyltransferase|nr:hypothetical protein [Chitinispirillales bacterium]